MCIRDSGRPGHNTPTSVEAALPLIRPICAVAFRMNGVVIRSDQIRTPLSAGSTAAQRQAPVWPADRAGTYPVGVTAHRAGRPIYPGGAVGTWACLASFDA